MSEHPHTTVLMRIEDEALRLGWSKIYPKRDFTYEVAEKAGELGNEYPSDNAIQIARNKLRWFKGYITRASKK